MVPMYTYLITEPTMEICIIVLDTVALTWVASDYGPESRQTCVSGYCGAYELTTMGMKSCLLMRLLMATEERRRRSEKSRTCHTQSPLLDFQV